MCELAGSIAPYFASGICCMGMKDVTLSCWCGPSSPAHLICGGRRKSAASGRVGVGLTDDLHGVGGVSHSPIHQDIGRNSYMRYAAFVLSIALVA